MPIVWLESLGDLQRDRDSSTFVLEQINTVQQRSPDPSDSSTNSLMSAGGSTFNQPAVATQQAALTKT